MPNLNPNSTNYVHSYEPNTNDLTLAMDYTEDGKPAVRVLSNIQGDIIIEGAVTIPGEVTVVSSHDDPLHTATHLLDENDAEYTDSNPFTVDGTVNIGTMPEVEIKNDIGNPISTTIVSDGVTVSLNHGLPIHIINDPNFLGVSRGQSILDVNLRNSYVIDKSGSTETLGISPETMSTVWDAADNDSLYPWNTFTGTGDKLYLFTDTDDAKIRGATILLEGLDSNYNIITETVTLDATDTTTVVPTVNNYYRFQTAKLTSNNTNYLPQDSDINIHYSSAGGQIVGKIRAPYGKTQQCLYTIPAGFEGFILSVNGSSGAQDEITSMIWVKPFEQSWHMLKLFKFINGYYEHIFRTPLKFEEKADLELRAFALVESSRISTEFQIILVPKPA